MFQQDHLSRQYAHHHPKAEHHNRQDATFDNDDLWYCCSNFHASISIRIDHCPDCQHRRCENCAVESIEHWAVDLSFMTLKLWKPALTTSQDHNSRVSFNEFLRSYHGIIPEPSTPNKCNRPKGYLTESQIKSLPLVQDSQSVPLQFLIDRWELAGDTKEEIHDISTSCTNSPVSTNSSESTTSSSSTTDTFTDEELTPGSDTDLDQNNVGSDEGMRRNQIIAVLDTCILSALGHNLSLAAQIITRIHATVPRRVDNGILNSTAAGSEAIEGSGDSAGSSISIESPVRHSGANARESINGRHGKRKKHSDLDDSDETNRPQVKRRLGSDSTQSPTFACHFHKKDPEKYCSFKSEIYRNCVHPKIPELRRIKDHFKNHRVAQCDVCFAVVENRTELVNHRRSSTCKNGNPKLKEGIDDGQWEKIEQLLKAKACPGKQDFEKWYDIWTVLFPETRPPLNPWSEPNKSSPNFAPDPETIMTSISANVDRNMQCGLLQPYRDMPQLYDIIRQEIEKYYRHGSDYASGTTPMEQDNPIAVAGPAESRGSDRLNDNAADGRSATSRSNSFSNSQLTPSLEDDLGSLAAVMDDPVFQYIDFASDPVPAENHTYDLDNIDSAFVNVSSSATSTIESRDDADGSRSHRIASTLSRPFVADMEHYNVSNIDHEPIHLSASTSFVHDSNTHDDEFEPAIANWDTGDLSAMLENELELPTAGEPIEKPKDRNSGLAGGCWNGLF